MDSQCPLAITSLLTMCYQGRAVQALKGFPQLYFSLSLSALNVLKANLGQVSREEGGLKPWLGGNWLCLCPALWQDTKSQIFLELETHGMLVLSWLGSSLQLLVPSGATERQLILCTFNENKG